MFKYVVTMRVKILEDMFSNVMQIRSYLKKAN
jgi:hypothetical protein